MPTSRSDKVYVNRRVLHVMTSATIDVLRVEADALVPTKRIHEDLSRSLRRVRRSTIASSKPRTESCTKQAWTRLTSAWFFCASDSTFEAFVSWILDGNANETKQVIYSLQSGILSCSFDDVFPVPTSSSGAHSQALRNKHTPPW